MNKEQICRLFYKAVNPANIKLDEPMKDHTSFKIGGPADIFITPDGLEEVRSVLDICRSHDVPLFIMGNGTDLLVLDGGIRGVVMQIADKWQQVEIHGVAVTAQSGILLSKLCMALAEAGLGGMEFASGIPGTLGGALVMNAGAYGGEMKDVVKAVHAVDIHGHQIRLELPEIEYGYRSSIFRNGGYAVLAAELQLVYREPQSCMDMIKELAERRRAKQPLEYPSAGSVFKRPVGYYVGPLIEQAGLKGMRIGDAQVSEKHAGFIINRGRATAKDVIELMHLIQQRVENMFGVELEPEIQIIGEER